MALCEPGYRPKTEAVARNLVRRDESRMNENPYAPPQAPVADAALPPMDKPEQVSRAVMLFWISLGLGVISTAFQWEYLTSLAGVGFALYVQAFTVAIYSWLIYKISRGRNWARITFLVLLLIGIIPFLSQLPLLFARSPAAGVIAFGQSALQIWALYLVFSEPGRRWFRRQP